MYKHYYLARRVLGWKHVSESYTTLVLDDLPVQWGRETLLFAGEQ